MRHVKLRVLTLVHFCLHIFAVFRGPCIQCGEMCAAALLKTAIAKFPCVAFTGRSVAVKIINELRNLMVSPMGLFFGGGHEEGGVGAESTDGEGACVLPSPSE